MSSNGEDFLNSQRRLIGSLLFDGARTSRVLELITPDDVQEPSLNLVMHAIANVSRRDEPVTAMTVGKSLLDFGALADVGGVEELYSLQSEGETYIQEALPELYAAMVKDYAAKTGVRTLIEETKDFFNEDSGVSAVDGISELQSKLQENMFGLSDEATILNMASYVSGYGEILDERLQTSLENEEKAEGLQGIPTPLPKLNKYTSGWGPGQLITVGARTGVGKSVFAIMSAVNAAKAGKSVLFFSLEMSGPEIADRIMACMSGVSMGKLKQGRLNEEERKHVDSIRDELAEMNLIIDTDAYATVDSVRAKALRQAQTDEGLDMIILDYLQLLRSTSKMSSRQEIIADQSRNMKLIAKSLGVPIMILAQLNRAKDTEDVNQSPTLDNIRESGAIAMDSDIVVLLHRDQAVDNNTPMTQVILEKNRNGESKKTIMCYSNLECSNFRQASTSKESGENLTDEDMDDLASVLPQNEIENLELNMYDADDMDDFDFDDDDDDDIDDLY